MIDAECTAPSGDVSQFSATDNCDSDVEITFADAQVDGSCINEYTITRTYTATDNCGNMSTFVQTINVSDNTPPTLGSSGVPSVIDVECTHPAGDISQFSATDNCDTDVEITFTDTQVDGSCVNEYTITRTYTATDNCGNITTFVQTINVSDNTSPTLVSTGIPSEIDVECTHPAGDISQFSATDNCDTDVEITFADTQVDGTCINEYTITRTYTAIDNCNNTSTFVQTINVSDNTDPVIATSLPAVIDTECDNVVDADVNAVTATDNCDTDVEITFGEVRTNGACYDSYTLTRTWTATDNCNNTSTFVQVVNVFDTTDPVLNGVPDNTTAPCGTDPDVPGIGSDITATDNCDINVEITFDELIIAGSCPDSYTLERIWTATDNCGNSVSQSQLIAIGDAQAPVITGVPSDATAQCDNIPDAPEVYTDIIATDDCDTDIVIIFNEITTPGDCPDNYTITRTWIATDNCENTSSLSQVITVIDTTDPVLNGVPANTTAICGETINTPVIGSDITATDNCDANVNITFAEIVVDGDCADSYTLERTWTATDNCGNSVSQTQTISVIDDQAPDIAGVPDGVIVECDNIPVAPVIYTDITATDNCDTDVEIIFTELITPGTCSENYTITRTWVATDNCGNVKTENQIITVDDNTNPILSGVPDNYTANCGETIEIPEIGVDVTAVDNCDTDVEITFSENQIIGGCIYSYTLERTWTATDNCGNQQIQTQLITVSDDLAPVISGVPSNTTASCENIPEVPVLNVDVTVVDNCDPTVAMIFSELITAGDCPNSYTITRTWTATDVCNNTVTETQVITVSDVILPVLVGVPADVSASCGEIPEVPAVGTVTATDNCDTDVEVTFVETEITGTCAGATTISRTWTATDDCGNTVSQTQIIAVGDAVPPVITGNPDDITVTCGEIPNQPIIGVDITVTDDCDADISIQFNEVLTPGTCSDNYTITRTWTATDDCENTVVETQVITVSDIIDPVLVGVPGDITSACGEIPDVPEVGDVTATDNCDTDVEITFNEVTVDGDCENSFIITRTWTATDNCGNQSSASQTIAVGDAAAPVFTVVPEDITLNCGENIDDPIIGIDIIAIDDCDVDIEITLAPVISNNSCPENYILTRTWTAVDACGNTATAIQSVTVQDNEAPTISDAPANISVECGNVPPPASVFSFTTSDNCDTDVEVTFDQTEIPGSCADSYTILRTWTATDNCGNANSVSQEVQVDDTQNPVLSGVPSDITVECHEIPNPPSNSQISATDNCASFVEIIYNQFKQPGDCPDSYILIREWVAIDNCGNEDVQTQEIIVFDDTAPVLSGIPSDITIDLNQGETVPTVPSNISATDNCDNNVNIIFEEIETPQGCGYILQRKWTATDNCGNAITAIQMITVLDDIEVVINPGDLTICSNETIAFTASPSGSGYTYQWTSTGGVFNNSQIANPVFESSASGIYTIELTVTSATACIGTDQITIDVNQGTEADATSNGPVCEDNTLELYGSGGTTYTWIGPDGFNSTEQNPAIENVQLANNGEYILMVSNGNNCVTYDTINIAITPSINLDYSAYAADCNSLGSITLGVFGGTGNYTFDWDDIELTTEPQNRINLPAGTYNVTITDDGGCEEIISNIIIGDDCAACETDAGTILADDLEICIENGAVVISATPVGDANVPPGFAVVYVLTTDPNMTILQTSNTPEFSVEEGGTYIIHTFVYDPSVFDLNVIIPGETSLFDINGLLIQGGGAICGSIDLNGATTEVHEVVVDVETNTPDNCNTSTGVVVLSPDTYDYTWTGGLTGAVQENLSGGTYFITATDDNGCSTEISVTVESQCVCITPEVNTVVSEPDCGTADGSIIIQVDGDPEDYVYTWPPNINGTVSDNGNEVTGVMSGIYTVTITYPLVANCDTIIDVTVGTADGPIPDVITVSPASCDAANGSAQLSPDTYVYIWVDLIGPPSSYQEGLEATTYQVIVQDPANPQCLNIIDVEISEFNPLEVEINTISEPSCGNTDGHVELTISGGSGDYDYVWSDPATTNDSIRTDLPAGDHTVTVTETDGSNCEFVLDFTLIDFTPGANLVLNPNVQVSCNGYEDGTVEYNLTFNPGFNLPDTVVIVDSLGTEYQNGELAVGAYCLIVYDANGCVGAQECFQVIEPMELLVSSSTTDVDCETNGTIDITVVGGSTPYTYDWADLNVPAPGTEPEDRIDLLVGNYIVTVTDANDCQAIEFNILIGDVCDEICESPVIENIQIAESTCGSSNGSVTINMIGDESDYIYEWPSPIGITTNEVTGLSADSYSVTITVDGDTCSIVEIINVSDQGATEVVIESTTPATCTSADGTASLSPANLDYVWNDGEFTGAVQTNLPADTYTVEATNAVGCVTNLTVIIESESPLEATATIDVEPTCGDSNGQVTILVTGGSGTYSYDPEGPIVDSLAGGSYSVLVTDDVTGCTAIADFDLPNNIAGASIIVDDVNLACHGDDNGEVTYNINYDPGFDAPPTITILDSNLDSVLNGTLSVGNYCIQIRDSRGCIAVTECFDVLEPSILETSVSVTDETCTEFGSIELTVNGGSAPYVFNWNGIDSSNLSSGSYNVTITDANDCINILENIIVNYDCETDSPCDQPVVNNIIVGSSNCGQSNGSITINMTGDELDYIYDWPLPIMSTTNEATNLLAGSYDVTITNVGDTCFIIETILVNDEEGTGVVIESTTPANCTASDGGAVLSPANLDYIWNDGEYTGAVQTNLPADTYEVEATDAAGCVTNLTVIIESVSPLEATVTIDIEPTCGDSNGQVTILVTGGSGDYSYDPEGPVVDSLPSGDHSILVTDNVTGCTAIANFTINDEVSGGATVSINTSSLFCAGDTTGTVDYTVAYDPNFVEDEVILLLAENGDTVTNGELRAGNYCIEVYDGNNCHVATECFEMTEPATLQIIVSSEDATCTTNGSATVTASGGTAPYGYDWGTANATDLPEGDYEVTITDANNCEEVITVSIGKDCIDTSCDQPVIENIVVTSSNCGQSNGSITINMEGDELEYIYEWPTPITSTTNVATDLLAGSYNVTITNVGDTCFIIETILVNDEEGTEVVIESTTPANCTASDGGAVLSPANLDYVWNDGEYTGAVQTNLEAGSYNVEATDAAGCVTNITVIIESVSPLEATVTIDIEPTCGDSNGQVTILVTGGSGDYSYDPEGPVVDSLPSGDHSILVTDNVTGCTAIANFTINDEVSGGATVSINTSSLFCAGDTTGTVDYTVAYDPNFVEDEVILLLAENGDTVTNGELRAGNYCIEVYDGNNCHVATECFEMTEPATLQITVSSEDATCTTNGSATVTASGGTAPYGYDWGTANATDLPEGNYEVTITDANNCEEVITVSIGKDCIDTSCDQPVIETIIVTSSNCGQSNGSITINMEGDELEYIYEWPTPITSTTNVATDLLAGSYNVTITNVGDTCFIIETILVNDEEGTEVVIESTTPANCTASDGGAVLSPANLDYVWNDGEYTGAVQTNLPADTYEVEATDAAGCVTNLTVIIESVSPLVATATIDIEPTCGDSNGQVTILVTGGSGDYSYDPEGPVVDSLPSGEHSVLVTDEVTGCTTIAIFTINDQTSGDATVTVTSSSLFCAGDTTGTVDYTVTYDPNFVEDEVILLIAENGDTVTNGELRAGNYCLEVYDGNNCHVATECFEMTEPATLQITVSSEDATCTTNGSATVTASGGAAPYDYDWGTANATDLPEGNYEVTITDANNCEEVITVSIGKDCIDTSCDQPVIENIVVTSSNCGQSNGSITINMEGDELEYIYEWPTPITSTTNVATDLLAGSYEVTITNVGDTCFIIETILVNDEEGTEVVIESTTPANCTASDGGAVLSPANLDYVWNDGEYTGAVQTNLPADTYEVEATDAAGCVTNLTVIIESVSPLVAIATIDIEPTCGDSNGQVTILVTGGSGDYSYDPEGPVVDSLPSGDHSILVTDNVTGCTAIANFTINDEVSGGATVSINTSSLFCAGDTTGTVDYTVAYDPNFVEDEVILLLAENGDTVTNGELRAGNYCLEVYDGNNCHVATECFEMTEPATLQITVSSEDATCTTNGSATVTATGGTAPYDYDWGTSNATDLPEGDYEVTITDANNCEEEITVTIGKDCIDTSCDQPVVETIVVTSSNCGQSNGSITINMEGDELEYIYEWPTPITSTTNVATDLLAGSYDVTITNVGDTCFIIETILVNDEEGTEVVIESTTPANCTASDGGAVLSPANLDYVWNDGEYTGAVQTNLPADTYEVEATDAAGCVTNLTVIIESVSPLVATATIDIEPTCGDSNGQVTILVTGGSGDYSYDPEGPVVDSLPSGEHSVLVTDEVTGCTTIAIFTINDQTSGGATVTVTSSSLFCAGDTTGTVDYTVTYDPNFVEDEVILLIAENGDTVTNGELRAGNYCLEVYDGNNCHVATECFEMTEPATLQITVSSEDATCTTNGSATVTASGGTAPYDYDWGTANATDLPEGDYEVTITDANNCEEVITVSIGKDCIDTSCDQPVVETIIVTSSNCGQSNGSITINMEGDELDYIYEWPTPITSTTNVATDLLAGSYNVTITNVGDTCFIIETILVNDEEGTEVVIESTTPANCTASDGGAVLSPANLDYVWNDGEYTGAVQTNLEAGSYNVEATDAAGCVTNLTVIIDSVSPLEATVTIDIEPTCGDSNGQVTILVTGGSGDYSYDPEGPVVDSLPSGEHSVLVTDEVTGCTTIAIFTISDEVLGGATVTVTSSSLFCAGDTTGTVDYTVAYDPNFVEDEVILLLAENGDTVTNGELRAGNYCLEVYDGNNCHVATECFEMTEPATLQITVSSEDATCTTNGSATVTASGGTAPYNYDWGTANATDLPEGDYEVTITDANNCEEVIIISIGKDCIDTSCDQPVVENIVVTSSNCGQSNGSITINMEGDELEYIYEWPTPITSTTNVATDLLAGSYNVTITNVGDTCFIIETILVNDEEGTEVVIESTTPANCTASDGGAVLSPANLDYVWNDGEYTGAVQTNLPADTYEVEATDAAGCVTNLTVIIESVSPLEATVTVDIEPTCGDSNGQVTILVTGGSGDYSYDPEGPVVDSLPSGEHSVLVTDEVTGCTTIAIFTINDQSSGGATVTVNSSSLFCAGDTTGTVDYTVAYDPNFVEDEVILLIAENGDTVTNGELRAGNYCLEVYDGNNCHVATECFEMTEPATLQITVSSEDATCTTNGSATVTASGGTAPYGYDWGTANATDLPEGNYEVTITDANNCEEVITVSIGKDCIDTSCDQPVIENIVVTSSNCGQSNGSITINMEGDELDYIYEWPSPITSTTNIATDLLAGSYNVTITNAGDTCFIIETIQVNDEEGTEVVIESTTPANCTSADGGAVLSPATLDYVWNDGEYTGAVQTNLEAGSYEVAATDAAGCVTNLTVEIESVSPLEATVTIDIEPTCGDSNGQVTILVTGGSGDYSYDPEGPVVDSLPSGEHSVLVTDEVTGCTTIAIFTISDEVLGGATVTVTSSSLFCAGDTTGTVDYTVTYDPNFVEDEVILLLAENGDTVTNGELRAGNYCLEVYDGNNCHVATECFEMTEPATLQITVSSEDATCTTNGSATVAASGGTAPYNYDWGTANATDLPEGEYDVTITDANNCEEIITVTIGKDCNECEEPVVETIVVSSSNCGQSNGSITINMEGDELDYIYEWPTPITSTTNIATDLLAGSYNVTITNAGDTCFIIETIQVNDEEGTEVVIESTTPANCTSADGGAVLSPATLDYVWNDGEYTGAVQTNLEAGSYEVAATDAAGCVTNLTVIIESVSPLEATVTIDIEPTCGDSNGQVTILVTGGSGDYSYDPEGPVVDSLPSGEHSVLVTDEVTGCTTIAIFTINDQTSGGATVTVTSSSLFCAGDTTGTVDYTVAYDPNFVEDEVILLLAENGDTVTNGELRAGNYCLEVYDGNNCHVATECFEMTEPATLQITVSSEDATCNTNGSATVTASGGTAPYNYDWGTANATDLPEGDYEVTITDANNCEEVIIISIGKDCIDTSCDQPIVENIVVTSSNCGQSNGSITINMEGNELEYIYEWPSPITSTTNVATDLLAGSYDVTITNVGDTCFIIETILVNDEEGAEVVIESTTPANCTASDGGAVLSPANLDYVWNDGEYTGAVQTNLEAGSYNVEATDAAGCVTNLTVIIESVSPLEATVTIDIEPTCGDSNGQVTILVTGGSGTYSYDPEGPVVDSLPSGEHSVLVTDEVTGCTTIAIFTINDQTSGGATVTVVSSSLFCAGDTTGTVDYTVAYDPNFVEDEVILLLAENGDTVTNGELRAGNYCLEVYDGNNCHVATECFEMTEPETLQITVSSEDATCTTNGSATVTASGGAAPYDYDWGTANATDLPEGDYEVTITDANNCEEVITVTIGKDCIDTSCDQPVVETIVVTSSNCGQSNGSITINMEGDELDYIYEWPTPITSTTNVATDLLAGSYDVTITNAGDTCFIIETILVNDEEGTEVVIESTTPANCTASDGGAVLSPANLDYVWNDGEYTGAVQTNLEAGSYNVEATDAAGCVTNITVIIESVSPLEATVTIDIEPTCGDSNGQVTILVTGGSGDYSYDPEGPVVDSLPSGEHSVLVTDNVTGCIAIANFTINDQTSGGATVTVTSSNLFCAGDTTGTVDYTVTYDPNFVEDEVILLLAENGDTVTNGELRAGNYCLEVYDGNNCHVATECFEMTEPATLQITVSSEDATCTTNGSATVTASGGTAPYDYDWGTANATDLPEGDYEVTITDANNCEEVIIISIGKDCIDTSCDQPIVETIVVTSSNCGQSNGSITINMEGDELEYIYEWPTPITSTTNVATDLLAGSYNVTITNAGDTCFIIETIQINDIEGPSVAVESTTAANCNSADGTASLSPANLDYVWNDGEYTGAVQTNLPAGIYNVEATDAAGCVTNLTIEIESVSSLIATATVTVEPTCGDNNGEATIDVFNGSGSYSFEPFGPTVDTLSSGTYTVTVTDDVSGCTTEVDIIVQDAADGEAIIIVDDFSLACAGDENGEVIYTITYDPNFALPDTVVIINETGTIVQNGSLSAGVYCIFVYDANGCNTNTECFEITEPEVLAVSVATTNAFCDTLGTISLDVTGGTTPYAFDWNGIDSSNLEAGFYNVIITDANGCGLTVDSIEIAEINCPQPCTDFIETEEETIIIQDCSDDGYFCIEVRIEEYLNYTVTDNGLLYTGSIVGCDFDSVLSYSAFAIPNQGTVGPYSLDSWTFEGQTFTMQFETIEQLVDSMNVWDPTSNWVFDNTAFAISGGNILNTYGNMNITQIATGAFTSLELSTSFPPNGIALGVGQGDHEVIFTNNITGCADTINVQVVCLSPEIYIDTIPVNELDTFCLDLEELPGEVVEINNICEDASGEFVLFELIEGQWCVSYWGAEVGTDTACIVICDDLGFCDTTNMYITVEDLNSNQPDSLPIAVTDFDTTLVNTPIGIDVLLNDSINGELDTVYILTYPNHGILLDNMDGEFVYMPSEDYCNNETPDSFTYVLCNQSGCDTATVFITVLCDELIVYTGFSPNGDGINDNFTIGGISEFPDNNLTIFNRWGNEVYSKAGYLNEWQGTWKNKALPDGTYFYILEDGEGNTFTGYVQIHR